jgi:hypothetical protein
LFVRPGKFFSSQLALGRTPYAVLVTWCYGISSAIDRVDTELMRAELGRARPAWEELAPHVAESWLGFWGWVLASGAFGGLLLWWIGGWWYRTRTRWSGASNPDRHLSRLVFVYSSFVFAGPAVAFVLLQTLLYPNYAAAYASDEGFSLLLLVFPFWSISTSYIGVTTLFDVSIWKARVWFVFLPLLAYLAVFGLLAALFAFFAPSL